MPPTAASFEYDAGWSSAPYPSRTSRQRTTSLSESPRKSCSLPSDQDVLLCTMRLTVYTFPCRWPRCLFWWAAWLLAEKWTEVLYCLDRLFIIESEQVYYRYFSSRLAYADAQAGSSTAAYLLHLRQPAGNSVIRLRHLSFAAFCIENS